MIRYTLTNLGIIRLLSCVTNKMNVIIRFIQIDLNSVGEEQVYSCKYISQESSGIMQDVGKTYYNFEDNYEQKDQVIFKPGIAKVSKSKKTKVANESKNKKPRYKFSKIKQYCRLEHSNF